MDIDDGGTYSDIQTLTFDDVNISGFSSLNLSLMIAEDDDGVNQDWDADTLMYVEVDIDNSGTFTKLIQVAAFGGTNTEPGLDTNFDGTADGPAITNVFTAFNSAIAGTGNTIDIRITFEKQNAGDEDIAIDKVVLTGN